MIETFVKQRKAFYLIKKFRRATFAVFAQFTSCVKAAKPGFETAAA